MNFVTAILILIGVLLEFVVLLLAKDLTLYGDENDGRRAIILHNLPESEDQRDGM